MRKKLRAYSLNPKLQDEPKYPQDLPQWPQYCPDIAQDGPKVDPSNPKVLSLTQDAQPTAYNIQHTSHITGPAECAVAIKSAAALRRLACGITLNLRSSVVQHPRGDAIPNPFPHRHSICVISNIAFHLRFIITCGVNVQIPRTQDACLTLRRPPWSHSRLPSQN